jgi:hypothetical protein
VSAWREAGRSSLPLPRAALTHKLLEPLRVRAGRKPVRVMALAALFAQRVKLDEDVSLVELDIWPIVATVEASDEAAQVAHERLA